MNLIEVEYSLLFQKTKPQL